MAAAVVAQPIICATSGACAALAAGASAALSVFVGAQFVTDDARVAARAAQVAAEAAHSAAVAAGEATAPLRAAAAAAAMVAAGQGAAAIQSAATRAAAAGDGSRSSRAKAALLAAATMQRLRDLYVSATQAAAGLREARQPTGSALDNAPATPTAVRTPRRDPEGVQPLPEKPMMPGCTMSPLVPKEADVRPNYDKLQEIWEKMARLPEGSEERLFYMKYIENLFKASCSGFLSPPPPPPKCDNCPQNMNSPNYKQPKLEQTDAAQDMLPSPQNSLAGKCCLSDPMLL